MSKRWLILAAGVCAHRHTWWYVGVAGLPPVAGWTYDVTGSAAAPIYYGAALIFLTLAALGLFRFCQARIPVAAVQDAPK